MEITCWGARGSIAVCGSEYIRYGGETTCLEIRGPDNQLIIVDSGSGIRKLGNKLMTQGPLAATLLLTHAHWDHIVGFPFFKPIFLPTTRLEIVCQAFKHEFLSEILAHTMAAPYFPVPLAQVKAGITFPNMGPDGFEAAGLTVDHISLSHPNGGVGYKFSQGRRSFVFLTDNELGLSHHGGRSFQEYRDFCQGADLLVHDAEYTSEEYELVKGYGHSTYAAALELALAAGVKRFGLFHHNQDRSDDQVDQLVQKCRDQVARAGADMEVLAMSVGLKLTV